MAADPGGQRQLLVRAPKLPPGQKRPQCLIYNPASLSVSLSHQSQRLTSKNFWMT